MVLWHYENDFWGYHGSDLEDIMEMIFEDFMEIIFEAFKEN